MVGDDFMDSKIIGIYTIQSINYGNRLQNYALQFVLEKHGFTVYSFSTSKNDISFKIKFKKLVKRLIGKDRRANFYRFNTNIHSISQYIDKTEINIKKDDYWAIIAGSDQIWNTTYQFVSINAFLPIQHPRKISFSASFGVDAIGNDPEIVKCLNDFKALSVREESGAKIIKELTGREATVLVDPTMLLTQSEWRKIEKKPKGAADDGFILTYFLSPKCKDAEKKLSEIRQGRPVYELLNPNDSVAGIAGPSEFLWLFDHADLILTDSFHACVFSFLFNKPFVVYDRNWNEGNMNSRLETLLRKFSLERKYSYSGLENDIWEHDYTEGYKQLEVEREKAIRFLKEALGVD